MTIPTFTPPVPPSLGSKQDVKYRIRTAGFGDGYVQRAADGINTKEVSWALVFNVLPTDGDMIAAFFDSLLGYQPFYYTMNGDIQRKYTASNFTRVHSEGRTDKITVTLTQVFDP